MGHLNDQNPEGQGPGDVAWWRAKVAELEATLHEFEGLIYRVGYDDEGEWILTFADGHVPATENFDTEHFGGCRVRDVLEPRVFDAIRDALQRAFDGETALYEMEPYPGYWAEGRVKPFARDAAGRVTEIICSVTDVTARKHLQHESSERRDRLEALVSALPDLVFIFDRNGVFVGYNVSSDDKLIAPPSSFLGARLDDILPPDVAAEARRVLNNVVLTGQRGEFHYSLNLDGRQEFFHARLVATRDERVLAVVRDITELVNAVRGERVKTQLLDMSRKVARLGYWSCNLPKRQIYWTHEVFDLLDLDPIEIVTPDWVAERLGRNTRDIIVGALGDAAANRSFRQIEIRRDFGNGDIRYYIMSIDPILKEDGTVEELQGTLQDITEFRRLEFQLNHLQKIDSLGRVAGAMAHDFNNMLQVINGYGECLRKFVATDPRASSYLEAMLSASDKTKDLVAGILSFARRTEPVLTEQGLDDFVAGAVKLIEPLMGARVRLTVEKGCPDCVVMLDGSAFTQVLVNLSVNARDAMPDGGELTIRTASVADADEAARLRSENPGLNSRYVAVIDVIDTGTGIPPEIQDKIFTPFFSTKAEGAGTGLGLSTASQIVSRHGGFIKVWKTGPDGTTFRVVLPAVTP